MKKFILNSLVVVSLLVACALPAKAQTTFSTNLSAGTSLCLAFPVSISSITVSGTASGVATVSLYDNSVAGITYTNPAYTSMISYATNITSIITNSVGGLQTNVFAGIYSTTATTAANTNTFPTLAVFTAGASLVSGPNIVNINTIRGLVAVGSTNATLQIVYRRLTAP